MEFFRFDQETGRNIEQYDSKAAVFSRIIRTNEFASIGCMYVEPGGVIGFHEAPIPQLFLVVGGEGWVTGADRQQIAIKKGDAVFWNAGEWHESGSGTGMDAIVIESGSLDPKSYMRAK
ncbi:cupin domain-containing protein [Peribacillus deserti]|uniref:Cupin n=1 Tax=Peribacillus deserti TaxID=673318 RepID=A0A2N5M5P4_9BACI|nr:cupin domain-containing protein [Peribacillus deserti]PLT29613.1 cupin [Peribacillus deserti]